MTTTRIEPSVASSYFTVTVQAKWNGTDITEANGGLFYAPVIVSGPVFLINWVMKFPTLTGSGVSSPFALTVPELATIPDQYCGSLTQALLSTPQVVFQAGVFSVTWAMVQDRSTTLRAMLSPDTLNY